MVGNPGEGRGEDGGERQGGQWGEPRSLPRISVELRQTIIQIGSGRSETLTNASTTCWVAPPPARMHVRAVSGMWVGGCA